ncbi:L-rhamnose-binding lectin SML-like [Solea senegalensis]|uniref:L-rhamnose-binding lectin SML-like n=1 Tax=Solea senegalensis TaxID=28829 RepID=A0AAV6QH82_SOLSE|nr:L-rhamnose-binding lectin SML-like [Solea senegalensis]
MRSSWDLKWRPPTCLQLGEGGGWRQASARLHVCCEDKHIKTWMSRCHSHFPMVSRWRTEERSLRDNKMVPLRLVAFGLLAAAWYFTRATEGEVIYACLNDTAEMSCDVGSKINLEHILYKVGVGTRCGEGKRHPDDGPDNYCSFPWAEMVVEDLCGNKRSCNVPVTDRVFGEYDCLEQTRYLEVSYTCAKPPPPPPPAPLKPDCEDKPAADA